MLIACACYLAPLWSATYPLMQDLPGHIEVGLRVSEALGLTQSVPDVFALRPFPWPNSLGHLALGTLRSLLPDLIAAKLILSCSVSAYIWLLYTAARRLGLGLVRPTLAAVSVYDLNWGFGFFSFIVGRPIFLAWILLAVGVFRVPERARPWCLALLQLPLFLAHGLWWCLTWLAVPILLWGGHVRPRAMLPSATVAFVIPWVYLFSTGSVPQDGGFKWRSPSSVLRLLFSDLSGVHAGMSDTLAYGLALGLGFLILLARKGGFSKAMGTTAWAHRDDPRPYAKAGGQGPSAQMTLWRIGIVLLALYAILPFNIPNVEVISPRTLSTGMALFLLCMPGPLFRRAHVSAVDSIAVDREQRRMNTLGVTAAFAFNVLHAGGYAAAQMRFEREEMQAFPALLAAIPSGSHVGVVNERERGAGALRYSLRYWPWLASLKKDIRFNHSFTYLATTYAYIRDPVELQKRQVQGKVSCDLLRKLDWVVFQSDRSMPPPELAPCLGPAQSFNQWHLMRIR